MSDRRERVSGAIYASLPWDMTEGLVGEDYAAMASAAIAAMGLPTRDAVDAAIDEYRRAAMKIQHIQTVTYRRNPSEHDVEQLDDASVRIDTARARVLALHAQARMEGVRELRAWLVNKAAPTYQNVKFDAGYFAMRDAMVDQIDAMLKGGDR